MMPPDLIEVIALVQEEIGAQLDILDQEGGAYALRCVQASQQPKTITGPHAPTGMHPKVGAMVRELVADHLYVRRCMDRSTR